MAQLKPIVAIVALAALAACGPDSGPGQASGGAQTLDVTRDSRSTEPYDGIDPGEQLRFTGTEPFWGGHVIGQTLLYSTPEDQDGTEIPVERFAGRGGLSFSGAFGDRPFEMMVTPLSCSDGMSDRTYPFTVTLQIGEDVRSGCGWSDSQPFEGPENP